MTIDRSLLASHALDRVDDEIGSERLNKAQYIAVVIVEDDGGVVFSEGWDCRDNADFNAWSVAGAASQLLRKVQDRWLGTE